MLNNVFKVISEGFNMRPNLFIRWYAIQWHITSCICTNLYYLFIFPLFLINFVSRLSQKFLSLWFSNFHSIFVLIPNRTNKLFRVITQPWRHPGAILWIHVIIHIFITIHPKSTIFTTHKLPAIFQQSDNPHPRARHDAHVRARQNLKMLKIQI